ncbi:MAG: preprotein translocase subunit YajC [Acidobacteriota bacterium]|nr:preprotein translocase subunit YajC [Acidobacteriota bacterium]
MHLFSMFALMQDGQSPGWYSMILPVGVIAIFYFLVIRPQMKQQKEHQSLVNALKKGDKVVTNGGIWGEVDEVDAQTIRLKVHDKMKIRLSRSAISGMQPKSAGEKESK